MWGTSGYVNPPTASAGSFAPDFSELAGHEAAWMRDLAILAQGQGLLAKTQHEASAVPAPYIEHLCKVAYPLAVWQILRAQASALHREVTGLRIKVLFQVSLSWEKCLISVTSVYLAVG